MKVSTELSITITFTQDEAMAVAAACRASREDDLAIRKKQREIAFALLRELKITVPAAEGDNPAFDIPIDHEFIVRTVNTLKAEGIYTVGQLVTRKEADLMKIEGLGKKQIAEIKAYLTAHHLSLAL